MATVIKNEHILRSVSHGDVSSNELFYHTPCLTKYTNQYNSFLSTNNIDSASDTWIKELALNKIILYIRDAELASSGTVFMVSELEAMYVEAMYGKLSALFDSAVQNNTQNTQDFFKSLVNIVGPVRQAMRLK